MGTKRPNDSGRVDSRGRKISVSDQSAQHRSDAPPPVVWPATTHTPSTITYQPRLNGDPIEVAVQASIPPRLADLDISIPTEVINQAAQAERALAALDQQAFQLAPEVIEAVTVSLLRAESISSSRIEGLNISNRRLSEAIHDPASAKRLAREVANNTAALEHAINVGTRTEPLTVDDLLEVHHILMHDVPGIDAGKLRTTQNWIGPSGDPTEAQFVPPPPEHVEALLDDLCQFVERKALPATIRAAIGHAQFEAIHPFPDGNGRVGRCLISVILRRGGRTNIVPPISGVCVTQTADYFDALQRFQQDSNPWPWVSQFCDATQKASRSAQELSSDIIDLQELWVGQAGNPRRGSVTRRLIEVLPVMSFTDADAVASRLDVDPNVARRGLNELERAGVLSTVAGRKRNRVWRADDFHELLDRYSAGFDRTAL